MMYITLLLFYIGTLYMKGLSLLTTRVLAKAATSRVNIHQHFASLAHSNTPIYKSNDMPDLIVKASADMKIDGDLLVLPLYKPAGQEKGEAKATPLQPSAFTLPDLPSQLKDVVVSILGEGTFKADLSSKMVVRMVGDTAVKYIALVGMGPEPKRDNKAKTDLDVPLALKLGKAVGSIARETKVASLSLFAPSNLKSAGLSQIFLGIYDTLYNEHRFKKVPDESKKGLQEVHILGCSAQIAEGVELTHLLTKKIVSGVNFAKDLVNAPANFKTPLVIAKLAEEMAMNHNLECKILGETECKERGMGAYLGVQQGSKFPPQFIHLIYRPDNSKSKDADVVKVALVGKGLTFDSGGYNLKAGAGSMIELMKFDMGGCAAVLGAAKAIAQLRPNNVEVHFISAVCENMISAEAMRPGDILTASNNKTIEVLNTDAEGRLTLADALVYAEQQGAEAIVDLATLTGACIVGLGDRIAALYSPQSGLLNDLQAAGLRSDESLWALPLENSYREFIKGGMADLKNISGMKGGGSITAALFLQEFVEKAAWAHIDMAGPVWDNGGNKATGYGVKLLVDFLLNAKKVKSDSSASV